MEVEKTGQHIWTFWLSIRNWTEPREEILFARKHGVQIHEPHEETLPRRKGHMLSIRIRGWVEKETHLWSNPYCWAPKVRLSNTQKFL